MKYKGKKVFFCTLILILSTLFSTAVVFADNSSICKTGTITGKVVNLRQSPNTSSKIIVKITYGEKVNIIDSSKGWHKVMYKKKEGWISSDYLKITETPGISETVQATGKVDVKVLMLRKKPDTASEVIRKLKKGDTFYILDSSKKWYSIKTSDDLKGWVYGDYIKIDKAMKAREAEIPVSRGNDERPDNTKIKDEEPLDLQIKEAPSVQQNDVIAVSPVDLQASVQQIIVTPSSIQTDTIPQEEQTDSKPLGQKVIEYASTLLNAKYKYGGNTPEEGFDCSGFVKYVFASFNINMERTAASQANQGITVEKDKLLMGDLVFFDTNGTGTNINHVGIYIGDGKFIHAASPRYNVTITSLSDAYYLKSYMTARRVLNQ
ncbi:MAG: SH3 domain-containing protein [Clostridia bacterium]|nr:SH3 domain-containing protein [Clostridia bacterium]